MMATTGDLALSVTVWNKVITRLGNFFEGEDVTITEKRQENQREVEKATKIVDNLNKLHDEVTNMGRAQISESSASSSALIPPSPPTNSTGIRATGLYNEKIDWECSLGTKSMSVRFPPRPIVSVLADYYIPAGGNLSPSNFGKIIPPQPEDQAGYEYPDDGLLQGFGVVKDNETRQPRHLDTNGKKALLVVKNGLTTGATISRVDGLDSFTRNYGIEKTSIETAILPYDK